MISLMKLKFFKIQWFSHKRKYYKKFIWEWEKRNNCVYENELTSLKLYVIIKLRQKFSANSG